MENFIINYWIIYCILGIISLIFLLFLFSRSKGVNSFYFNLILLLWIPFSFYFLGLRESSVGTDSENYQRMYDMAVDGSRYDDFDEIEYLFYLIIRITSIFSNYHVFFLLVHLIFTSSLLFFLKLNEKSYSLIFVIYISSFFYFNLSTNIIRNSLAIPFWMLAIYSLELKRYIKGGLYCIVSVLFHKTSLLILLGFIICKYLSARKLTVLWLIVSFFSIINKDILIEIMNLTPLGEYVQLIKYSVYIDNKDYIDYSTGFRADFWIINASFIFFLIITNSFRQDDIWCRMFIMLSIFAVFAYQFPYSDRTSLFSWFLIPFIYGKKVLKNVEVITSTAFLKIVSFCFIIGLFSFYILIKNGN